MNCTPAFWSHFPKLTVPLRHRLLKASTLFPGAFPFLKALRTCSGKLSNLLLTPMAGVASDYVVNPASILLTLTHSPCRNRHQSHDDINDQDSTPKPSDEQWLFTPSLYSQTSDLHTPGIGLGSLLLLPTSEVGAHAGTAGIHGIQPQTIQFHNSDPFISHQSTFSPHQSINFESIDPRDASPMYQSGMVTNMTDASPIHSYQSGQCNPSLPPPLQSGEMQVSHSNARFHGITLEYNKPCQDLF